MYAVVSTGGKQLKVEKSTVAVIEKLDAEVGDSVTLPALLVADGDNLLVGPACAGASVVGTVVGHEKGDKQIVFKFKKRKGYKRTKGHRQLHTLVEITDIVIGDAPSKKAPAKKAATPEKAPAKKAATPKKAAAPAEVAVAGQCEALKADGSRCANKAKDGSVYCGVHAKKHEA